ncbi:hypothetical protein HN512_00880 [Candidatus Peregrinibacteria bacterium]|nr:hypothetical protein [Candidatus Peregrinibacteria bacterium]
MNRVYKSIIGSFLVTACAFIVIPINVSALSITEWDFRTDFVGTSWQASGGIAIEKTADGMKISSGTKEERIITPVSFLYPADSVGIIYSSEKEVEIAVQWQMEGSEEIYQTPIRLHATDGLRVQEIDMSRFGRKTNHVTKFGFLLYPNTSITIQKMQILGWSPTEKVAEFLKGFWAFDVYGPFSVNFLWGPRFSTTPVMREQMFQVRPPLAGSANIVIYILTALGLIIIVWIKLAKKCSAKVAAFSFLILIGSFWVLYDIRMSAETVNYLINDYSSYYSKDVGERTFRERSFFSDFSDSVAIAVENEDEYIFISSDNWPYQGLIRYATYPSLPTHQFEGNANKIRYWVVYERPDISINENNQLVSQDGQILSPVGEVMHEYAPGTFIFLSYL